MVLCFQNKLATGYFGNQSYRANVRYVARDVYKVPRLHKTCVMLPDVPSHNIKTPVFTLRSAPGNITHCLPGTTGCSNCVLFGQKTDREMNRHRQTNIHTNNTVTYRHTDSGR